MAKELSKMTLAELWKLFPIILTEHKTEWSEQFEQMAAALKKELACYGVVRISHIGSTAINRIWAKPIIDILVEIAHVENMCAVSDTIIKFGFTKMSDSEGRVSFNLGYTPNGFAEKVFHLHLRFHGDNSELYFRDYLNEFPAVAKDYENLKLGLWHRYEYDRDAYTAAKTEFVDKYTLAAKERYKERY